MSSGPRFVSWRRLGLAVPARGRLHDHLVAEYGPPAAGAGDARFRLHDDRPPEGVETWSVRGGHKGTRWSAALGPPDAPVVDAWLRVRGPFGLALLQSQVVEPLLGVVVARPERALVPAAALRHDGVVELIVGDAAAGKTSLAMRALGAGWDVLGDDRVFVGVEGVEGFRRRHRVYADARRTAPAFVAGLRERERIELAVRGAVAGLSRGFVRLPALLPPRTALAGTWPVAAASLLVRGRAPDGWRDDADVLAERLGTVIDRDTRWVAGLGGPWPAAVNRSRSASLEALRRAVDGRPVRLVVSPDAPAEVAIADVAAAFGIPA